MNKIEFTDSITAYLDGDLNEEQKRKFESLLESDPECKEIFDDVVDIMRKAKDIPPLETSRNFIPNLNKRIENYENQGNTLIGRIKGFFGVSPSESVSSSSGESPSVAVSYNSSLGLAMSFAAIVTVSYFAINPPQSQSALSAEQVSTTTQEDSQEIDYMVADIDTTENEGDIQLVSGDEE